MEETGPTNDAVTEVSIQSQPGKVVGSGKKKVPTTNRLLQPTASSVAKNKRVGAGRGTRMSTTGMKPPPTATVKRGVKPAGVNKPNTGRPPAPATGRGRRPRGENAAEKTVLKRDRTPDTIKKVPTRGSSTPTADNPSDTILDAWDASQIPTVNRTQIDLNDTTALEPCQALQFLVPQAPGCGKLDPDSTICSTEPTKPSLNTTRRQLPATAMKRPLTTAKTKRLVSTAFKGADSGGTTILEDPEYISDEQMDLAYCRYIQSEYIKRTSQKALQRTQKECDTKLLNVWKLLEQSRQEVLKLEEELVLTNIVSDMQDTLEKIGPLLGVEAQSSTSTDVDLLERLRGTHERMLELSNGLEDVKHNIEVKGIAIETQDRSAIAGRILELLRSFNSDWSGSNRLLTPEIRDNMQVIERYCIESESIVSRTDDYAALIEACRKLAVKEASLKMSFSSLKAEQPEAAVPQADKLAAAAV